MAACSFSPLMKLRMSAAARVPPIGCFFRTSLPDSSLVRTSFNSRRAVGCTPESVAIRSSTSLRRRSVKQPSTSQAWSRSRCTRMVAMVCGCSLWMRSATDSASIHFRLSIPLASPPPPRMRLSSEFALSSPSAFLNTLRIYSSESTPSDEFRSASLLKSCSTVSTSSCGMDFMPVIASPSFCTSRGPRYFMTSDAPSSPRASIRMAPLVIPFSLMTAYPGFDDIGDDAWILAGQFLRTHKVFLVIAPARERQHVAILLRAGIMGGCKECRGRGDLLQHRLEHAQIQQQQHDAHQQILARLQGQIDGLRLLPQRYVRYDFRRRTREGTVHDVEGVAARLVVAHGFLDQIGDLGDFGRAQRLHDDLAALVDGFPVVDDHGNRQALQSAARFLHVLNGLVDFIVDGGVLVRVDRRRGRCGHGGGLLSGSRDRGGGRRRRLIGERARHA